MGLGWAHSERTSITENGDCLSCFYMYLDIPQSCSAPFTQMVATNGQGKNNLGESEEVQEKFIKCVWKGKR